MGHDGVASGYLTPTGFRRLTGCQRDPWDRGVTCRVCGTRTCEGQFLVKYCRYIAIYRRYFTEQSTV